MSPDSVRSPQVHSMLTRDGVRLDADVYWPATEGEFPVLLMRQPYGRAIASTVVYAHPTWYAAQGYIVVIQDVRGRGTSEGEFDLYADDVNDGFDTVAWAAQLPQSSGRVGMYGFSYQGMTQLYAAMAKPPALKALAPGMLGYDLYADWGYEGGAFCWQANLGWAIQLAAETARLKGDQIAYAALRQAARSLPLTAEPPARPTVLKTYAPESFYHAWVNHPDPAADYWRSRSPNLTGVDLPMLHIGGWYDAYLRGTLRLYNEMAERSQYPQPLVIGPWCHIPWSRKVGEVDFGAQANSNIDRLQLRWFDWQLKGQNTGLANQPPVQLFELGTNQWRWCDRWPDPPSLPSAPPTPTAKPAELPELAELLDPATADKPITASSTASPPPDKTTWYLTSTGLAGMTDQDGHLVKTVPGPAVIDTLVHDPWRPVPALGGHAAAPTGMCDRASVDGRSDVLTYTTAQLTTAIEILGTVQAQIFVSTTAPSFDLCAVLSIVQPTGQVHHLCQGYRHIPSTAHQSADAAPAYVQPVTVTLQPICAQIQPGQALRLSLSAACFPAFPVNPGTGASPLTTPAIAHHIITLTIHSGGARSSWITW